MAQMANFGGSEGTIVDDVDDAYINSMRERLLLPGDGPMHKEHLIYRVHSALRKENARAYEPIAISIGPYHRGKQHLQPMETHKRRYLRDLLSRNPEISFEKLVKMIKTKEDRVRRCYPEDINLDFVEMMLLDGCFLIEFLLKHNYGQDNDDLFIGPHWRRKLIRYDLLLLENQLPFFILQDIFEIVIPNEGDSLGLVKLSLELLKLFMPPMLNPKVPLPTPDSVYHLLHLLHASLRPNPILMHEKSEILKLKGFAPCLGLFTREHSAALDQGQMWMPSVKTLQQTGVKFKVGSNNLLEIKFCNGVMEIPSIHVFDETEGCWRNLIAFEQCCLRSSHYYFTSYMVFMDYLCDTSKDIKILLKNGILKHGLGNNREVASLFNSLCKQILVDYKDNYLSHTVSKVNEYSNHRMHKWRASLVRDYFYSPWAVLSLIAAIIILFLTATQTVYSVLSYIYPR